MVNYELEKNIEKIINAKHIENLLLNDINS